ncbi:hypothetical protein PVE50_23785 [Bacillus toyonensis]|uniref:hypothetical protein n=1 Tax=Bacillus TaxID=1386 RepID=UPI0021CFC30A|nr:hypothetical protein [Bacillus toyonensis]MCU5305106.1 hypothetical protein [Bacillus toyonensis]MCU5728013.1 hypothetical protein [Bacillus toyonensis]MDD9264282.1 hypothetical protein [Bacillus toyonensis]
MDKTCPKFCSFKSVLTLSANSASSPISAFNMSCPPTSCPIHDHAKRPFFALTGGILTIATSNPKIEVASTGQVYGPDSGFPYLISGAIALISGGLG